MRAVLTCLVLLAVPIVGCDDEDGDRDEPGENAALNTLLNGRGENPPFAARVEITKDGYSPRHARILVGGRVTFVNMDKTAIHTAETEDLPDGPSDSNEFDTHSLTWEEPYTIIFHKPERVEYHSSVDPEMTGTVEAVPKQ